MRAKIEIPREKVEEFCHRNHVRRLALFGSALRDDFSAQSDVDVLIEFEPGAGVGMIGLAGLEIELSGILGRRAELHTFQGLNPRFRDRVLVEAEVLYDAA